MCFVQILMITWAFQLIIRIWSKHSWNYSPLFTCHHWLHILISYHQISLKIHFSSQNIPHLKARVVITIITIWLCTCTYYFHFIRSAWKSTFDLHEFVRNLIKNLSYSASVIWIPPEIQNWGTLQCLCEWIAFVEHESSKRPPLTHSFVLYKWKKKHNLIFTQVPNSLKSWVSSRQFFYQRYFLLVMDWSFRHIIICESWWRRIAWQPEGQHDTIRKQDQQGRDNSSEDKVNNSFNFLTVLCCMHIYHVLWHL